MNNHKPDSGKKKRAPGEHRNMCVPAQYLDFQRPILWYSCMFNELRSEMIVRFVDIDERADNDCLIYLYHTAKITFNNMTTFLYIKIYRNNIKSNNSNNRNKCAQDLYLQTGFVIFNM